MKEPNSEQPLTPTQYADLLAARAGRHDINSLRELARAVITTAITDARYNATSFAQHGWMRQATNDLHATQWMEGRESGVGGFAWWCSFLVLDPCAEIDRLESIDLDFLANRQKGSTRRVTQRDTCPHGHPLSGHNLFVRITKTPNGYERPYRSCRECHNTRTRNRKRRLAAAKKQLEHQVKPA